MSRDRFDRYIARAQLFGARTLLFQEAAARRLDLTARELECIRLVQHEGPLTAADLSRETGVTQASMSVIAEKLVTRGVLLRTRDEADRRRWLLHADPAALARIDALYDAHASRVTARLAGYGDAEFEAVLAFLQDFAEELKATAVEFARDMPTEGSTQDAPAGRRSAGSR